MPVELYMLDKLKARIQLAREIDSAQHKAKKAKHGRNWLKEAAEAMEIELDSDLARYVHCASPSTLRFDANVLATAATTTRGRRSSSKKWPGRR